MKTILLALFAALLHAEELVEVKELPPAVVAELKAADEEVEASAKALAEAQKKVLDARLRKLTVELQAKDKHHLFDGDCRYPAGSGMSTLAVMVYPSRKFRRATISGKFLLIQEGSETCAHSSTGTVSVPISQWPVNVK